MIDDVLICSGPWEPVLDGWCWLKLGWNWTFSQFCLSFPTLPLLSSQLSSSFQRLTVVKVSNLNVINLFHKISALKYSSDHYYFVLLHSLSTNSNNLKFWWVRRSWRTGSFSTPKDASVISRSTKTCLDWKSALAISLHPVLRSLRRNCYKIYFCSGREFDE